MNAYLPLDKKGFLLTRDLLVDVLEHHISYVAVLNPFILYHSKEILQAWDEDCSGYLFGYSNPRGQIYINGNQCADEQCITFVHEIVHMALDVLYRDVDFLCEESIDQIAISFFSSNSEFVREQFRMHVRFPQYTLE